MLKLTYLFHSGFVIETSNSILIFDYWMDPSNSLSAIFQSSSEKRIYVFASHFHEDHFSRTIFEWKAKSTNITYILSKDILKHRRAQKDEANVWLAKGGTWTDECVRVAALGSNDSGVSWIVEAEGKRIFHAGDLCNWYARFLSINNQKELAYSTEFGYHINPLAEEKRFLGELKDIRKVADNFDIVMFPVDARIGNGYTLGARQFIERFKVGIFVPMHFVTSGFESAWRMAPFCEQKQIPFWSIGFEGESIVLNDDVIIRHALKSDVDRISQIFNHARDFMVQTGNPNQWTANYPNAEVLNEDIEKCDCYVIQSHGQVEATFVLKKGIEPAYSVLKNGEWLNDEAPYITIHRVASSGKIKGILHLIMQFAKVQRINNLRIDTHRDNKVMLKAIEREGFTYCGLVYYGPQKERLAFQLILQK